MTYIYNKRKDLRTTFSRIHYTSVKVPEVGRMLFAMVNCDDESDGDWAYSKTYCGVVSERDNEKEIREILHSGAKTQSIQTWLNSL